LGALVTFAGASKLSGKSADLFQAIGRFIATKTNLRIATSGYGGDPGRGEPSLAYVVSHAVAEAAGTRFIEQRVVTFISRRDQKRLDKHFVLGTERNPAGRHHLARRLLMLSSSDVVCIAGGERGTRELCNFPSRSTGRYCRCHFWEARRGRFGVRRETA